MAKLGEGELQKVRQFAQTHTTTCTEAEDMLMFLYYGGCDDPNGCIAGMTALSMPTLSEPARGSFVFSLRVAYALTGAVPFSRLRKEVDRIFAHWKWSGDVTYRILSFKPAPVACSCVNVPP